MIKFGTTVKYIFISIIVIVVGAVLFVKYIFSQVNTVPPYQIANSVLFEIINQNYQYIENDTVKVDSRLIVYEDGQFELFFNYRRPIIINTKDPYNHSVYNSDGLSRFTGTLKPEELTIAKDAIENKKYNRRTEMVISRYESGWGEVANNHIGDHFLIRQDSKTIEIEDVNNNFNPLEPMMILLREPSR